MKSRNPSLLSNSAGSFPGGRRAAALPNRPKRIIKLPYRSAPRVRANPAMFKMPVSYRCHSGTAWQLAGGDKQLSEPGVHVLSVRRMRGRTRIIWSRPGNPTRRVATALGITLPQLGDAIHAIKKNARLRPREKLEQP